MPLSSEYSPDRFYVDSSDNRGHHKQVRIDVPPMAHGLMAVFVASPNLPYKTFYEFVRDSIIHNLHRIESIDPENEELKAIIARAMTVANADKIENRLAEEKSVVARYSAILNNPETNIFVSLSDAQAAYDSLETPSLKRAFKSMLAMNDRIVE